MSGLESEPLLASEQSHNTRQSSSLSARIRAALAEPQTALNGLEKLLAAGCVVFLLLTATFAGLFAGEAVRLGKERRHDGGGRHGEVTTTVTASVPATTTSHGSTTVVPGPPGPTSTGKPGKGKHDHTCLTSTCVTVAAQVLNALDTSIDPCVDFYQFANGGWLESNPIPDGQGFFGSAQAIGLKNKRIILDVLNPPSGSSTARALADESLSSDVDKENLAHLRTFYAACMDEGAQEEVGRRPLLEAVEEIVSAWRGVDAELLEEGASEGEEEEDSQVEEETGGEELVMEVDSTGEMIWKKKKKNKHYGKKHDKKHDKKRRGRKGGRWYDPETKKERLTNTLMWMHSRSLPALFEIYPAGDIGTDPSDVVAWLQQSGLGLPSKDYYSDSDDTIISIYTEVIAAALKDIYEARGEGRLADEAKELAREVVRFEKKVAKASLDVADLEDPKKTYNPTNATTLSHLFPVISFPNYFASFTPRPAYPDPVVVASPKYLKAVAGLLENLDPAVLEAYFVAHAAQEIGPLLGVKQPTRRAFQRLSNALIGITDPTVSQPRSDICLASLIDSWGFLVGRYYVQRAFGGDSKEVAEDIIVATIQAFKDRLPELDWLDEETRKKAEEKASAITHKIGYPTVPDTLDPASLAHYYALNLPVQSDAYAANVLRARMADQRRSWVKVGRKVVEGEWEMVPEEVNAYYQPSANEIVFPAGILQQPYFSADWPEYLQFGSFGCVAGHELSHAFDQAGRLYNKVGKLEDWWTKNTTKQFEHLQQCILDQYANYSVQDARGKQYYIQSHLTNGEDMADAGGIEQAFRAWKDRFDSDEEHDNYLLPGLEFTREQLFFIAYAQGWARNIKPAEAVKRIRTDPHSPTNFRVIGPLSNNVEFSKAFGCKVGQPMSNEHKCKVW